MSDGKVVSLDRFRKKPSLEPVPAPEEETPEVLSFEIDFSDLDGTRLKAIETTSDTIAERIEDLIVLKKTLNGLRVPPNEAKIQEHMRLVETYDDDTLYNMVARMTEVNKRPTFYEALFRVGSNRLFKSLGE
jgi:hypothetical protein